MNYLFVVLVAFSALAHCAVIDVTFSNATLLTVDDVSKDSTHPYFNQGFPRGYSINGVQGAEIRLTAGLAYTFFVRSLCNHPFYFSTHPSGQNLSEFRTGVVGVNYARTCGDLNVTFTPPAEMIGKELYYQCRTHSKMGWKITIVAETFCNKYSRARRETNLQLVSTVVGAVFQRLIEPDVGLLRYFDGTINRVNYTSPGKAAEAQQLSNNLIAFFGIALGCTDPSYPAYTGDTNMQRVHAHLPISSFEFDAFNGVIIAVMRSAGVSEPDLTAVLGVLSSLGPAICNTGCRNSICDRYSAALNLTNVDLVTTVVVTTFTAAIQPASGLRGYFNGSIPAGSTDFTTDATARGNLVNKLVAFFGSPGALACSDDGYPQYTGPSLKSVHDPMPIGLTEFNTFNGALIGVLAASGVAAADRAAVLSVLESTKPAVCNQPDCGNPVSTTGNPSATSTTGVAPITPDITFVVDVVTKDNTHPNFNNGFPSGFRIDGSQGPRITLTAGRYYVFRLTQSCAHPFYITTSEVGIGDGLVRAGVTYPQGDPSLGCDNREIGFNPTAAQIGQSLYYQCLNHQRMGYQIEIVGGATTGAGASTTGAGVVDDSSSFILVPSLLLSLVLLFALF